MTLRKVPGALALGMLASLAAHAALYGGGHVVGGAYHALLIEGALAGALALVLFFGGLAWMESGLTSDGSVLAVRLRERLPGLSAIVIAAAGWYSLSEALEQHHRSPSAVAIAIALLAAAWLAQRIARSSADVLARAALAVLRIAFAPRTPSWNRRERLRPIARRALRTRRRFARPPPVSFAIIRA